jgi:cell wall assembly regulator SMI1
MSARLKYLRGYNRAMDTAILRSNAFGPLAEEELAVFEHELKAHLPQEYRDFLLLHNGGTPQPACFLAAEDPLEGEELPMSEREVVCFFALHRNPWDDSTEEGSLAFPLQAAWRDLEAENPGSSLLPIGKDWSGNTICLSYAPEQAGRILFYDHEYEVVTPLASSFDAFLSALKPCLEQQG